MATITDYNTLKTAISDWLATSEYASYVDYFIQMAENMIYRDIISQNEGRGVRQMEASLSGTISSNAIAIPSDYLALKSARVVVGSRWFPLEKANAEFIYTNYPTQSATSAPTFIAEENGNFIFGPYSDSAYTVNGVYWQKATALSSSNTTTWMTSNIPDVLLAACMSAASEFTRDDNELQKWGSFYNKGLTAFINQDKTSAWSGSSLAIRGA